MNIENADLVKTIDTNYKNGFVECNCGWRKELGDGFNQYYINKCPNCSLITTREQTALITGTKNNYKIMNGKFTYFVINNCIHVLFKSIIFSTEYAVRLPK